MLLGTVNADALVPFVSGQLQNLDLAMALARRGNLPGAEGLVVQQFQRLYAGGQYKEAAELAAESPQGALRTKETIEAFKRVPAAPGQTSPLLVYFGTILTKSQLNALESVELGRLVVGQNKKQLLDNWWKASPPAAAAAQRWLRPARRSAATCRISAARCSHAAPCSARGCDAAACRGGPLFPSPQEGKLTASEELGDLFKGASDWDTAQAIYQQSGASGKVVEALAAKGDFEQLVRAPAPPAARWPCSVQAARGRTLRAAPATCWLSPWVAALPRPRGADVLTAPLYRPPCRRSTRAPAAPPPTTSSCCSAS